MECKIGDVNYNVKIGDVVPIIYSNLQPQIWIVGKITDLFRGPDLGQK